MNELLLELVQAVRRAQLGCETEARENGAIDKDTYLILAAAVDTLIDEVSREVRP